MHQRVTPQLRSTNWAKTRTFYEDGLGFRVQWEHRFEPGFPVFAQVSRNASAAGHYRSAVCPVSV